MADSNVVSFPLNELAKHRERVRNPAPKIPDDLLRQANAEIDEAEVAVERERPKE